MSIKSSPELKAAILNLPEKERDKLLLRLIRKDLTLIEQLHFQLLEDQIDLEERRERTLKSVNYEITRVKNQLNSLKYYYPRDLLIDLKSMSGFVNQHFLITKDKSGEIDLRLHILSQTFQHIGKFFDHANHANEKLLIYTTGRIKNIFIAYKKLHEDLQYDYKEKINEVLEFSYSSALKNYLLELAIPQEV